MSKRQRISPRFEGEAGLQACRGTVLEPSPAAIKRVSGAVGRRIAAPGLATLLLVMLAACSTVVESPSGGLGELGEGLARTLCPGPPTEVEQVRNRHVDGQVDRLETRRCAAGRSTLYIGQTTASPDGLAVMVEVVMAGAGLPSYLEIGQPVRPALQRLGALQGQSPGSATYRFDLEGEDHITLGHRSGRITAVQWVWMVD